MQYTVYRLVYTVYRLVYNSIYSVYTPIHFFQVRRFRAYLDSLSMDGAEVATNCLCSVRSCATCWCPDPELADGHRGECQYSRMAEVMEQLDAARDELLDDEDELVGRVKDVKEVEKRLRQSWQSGLGETCRTSWVLPTKQISELQPVQVGLLQS